MKLFLAPSAGHLLRSLVRYDVPMGRFETFPFADQERGYRLKEEVKGRPVGIVACILPDPRSLFDLMALHRLLCDNGAARIDLILPYLGYARQDRPNRKGEASIGLMVAETIMKMKASRRILFDIHSPRIREALGRSTTELSALPLFAEVLSKRPPEVIVSPDAGSILRVEQMAKLLDPRPELATIEKVRPRPNVAIAKRLYGDVRGKDVLILDDMIDTGGTLAEAVRLISLQGPRTVRVAATHGIFSGDARDRLARLPLKEILTTNTLPQVPHPQIRTLDIVPLLREAL